MLGHEYHLSDPSFPEVALCGDVDVYRRWDLRNVLDQLKGERIAVVDVTGVAYFDLTLINGLIYLKNEMAKQSGTSTVRLKGASRNLRRIIEICELTPAFEFSDSCSA